MPFHNLQKPSKTFKSLRIVMIFINLDSWFKLILRLFLNTVPPIIIMTSEQIAQIKYSYCRRASINNNSTYKRYIMIQRGLNCITSQPSCTTSFSSMPVIGVAYIHMVRNNSPQKLNIMEKNTMRLESRNPMPKLQKKSQK